MPPQQPGVPSRRPPSASPHRRPRWPAASALLAALALAACSHPGPSERSSGDLAIVVAIAPDPPTVGRNTLTVLVRDPEDAPVSDAVVDVLAQMPMMGHGSSETAVVQPVAAGTYRAYPLTFAMPGQWEVTVTATATAAAGQTGTSVTRYDVR